MRSRVWFMVLVALASVGAACGEDEASPSQGGDDHGEHEGPESEPAFEEGAETTKVDVTLQDYAFVGIPDSIQGPNVLFSGKVKGSNTHEIEVMDAGGKVVGVVHGFEAGTTKKLAVTLQPGTYTAVCLIKEGSRTHADLGMKKTFTVT